MKYEREIKYTETLTIEELPNSFLITGLYGDFVAARGELEAAKQQNADPFVFAKGLRRFRVYPPEVLDLITTTGMSKNLDEYLYKEYPVSLATHSVEEIEKTAIYFDSASHLFYDLHSNFPISRAYFSDYIGGICNSNFDLDKAELILKQREKEGLVWGIKRKKIPYYNASKYNNEAVEFYWRLPQEMYNQRVVECQAKGQFWSVLLKEISPLYGHSDVLGLKAAYKENKVTESSEDEDDD